MLKSKQVSLKRLFSLIWPHRALFALGMIALLIAAALNLVLPALVKDFIDKNTFDTQSLINFCLLLIFLFFLQAISFYLRTLSLTNVGIRVVEDIRIKLYRAIIDQNIGVFDTTRLGDLTSRLTTDVQLLQDAASLRISVFIRYAVQVLFGVILMLWLSPALGGALLLIIPILVGTSISLGKKLRKASRAQQDALSTAASLAEESFLGIKSIRSLGIESFFETAFKRASHIIAECSKIRTRISGFFQAGVSFLMNIALVGVIAYGMWMVSQDKMSAGSLTAFLLYGVTVAVSFAFLSTGYTELLQSLGGVERVFEIIDSSSEEATHEKSDISQSKEIILNHVSFTYPSRPEVEVIKDLSLKIPFGAFVGIAGYSGSGKSTVLQLISGFYPVKSGRISIGGREIESFERAELSKLVNIVPQDPWVFGGTLKENLTLDKAFPEEDLQRVINITALDELIHSLPKGLDTELGPRGVQLSGGQRQRIGLARALLRSAPILLLDEATSSLDAETEARVLHGLEQYRGSRTILLIAHRLSAIQKADVIFLMAQGKVIESGSHAELTNKATLYRELVKLQAMGV